MKAFDPNSEKTWVRAYLTLHYGLSGVFKINPEFQFFCHFLNILNVLRCMNAEFINFDPFKPKVSNFKAAWLKVSHLD